MITCIPSCAWKKQAPKHLLSSIKSSFGMFQHIEHKTGQSQSQKFRSLKTSIQLHFLNKLHYEGYSNFTSSTNNSLEATNRVIKDEHTFGERLRLSRFFTIGNDIVKGWFKSCSPHQISSIIFATESTITLQKWTNPYHFAKSSKSVLETSSKRKEFTDYYIPAGEAEKVTTNKIQQYKRENWTSFDQFKGLQFRI
ncbi:unnamed protein product [Rotaria sp. Silwood1]|nr:unnamed protein product [Rotaria sp. Silwood1]